jgi:hypothetical protein
MAGQEGGLPGEAVCLLRSRRKGQKGREAGTRQIPGSAHSGQRRFRD